MTKRALWIFDENYLLLTYLSVSSFIKHCDVIPTLIFCGGEMKANDKSVFLELDPSVEILYFDVDVSQWEEHMQANILNRLARLHYTRLFEDDLLFMIDSDVAFNSELKKDILEVEAKFRGEVDTLPMISGVVEFMSASDAYLYFKKKVSKGFTRKTTEVARINSYETIYGLGWKSLIQGFQFNNGFLIFYKARKLVDQWEKYYLDGLKNEDINPLDDQVPLAAAIQKTKCIYWKMDSKWNSLGDLNGSFNMFHAWGGEWKMEIDHVIRNQKATSDYGVICMDFIASCPERWIVKFNEDLKDFPYRYRHIKGAFDHGTVFTDLLERLDEGHIVEVGTYKGRSACFVAELIKAKEKDIIFETIDHYDRSDIDRQSVLRNLENAGVESYVKVIESESLNASSFYDSNQLDFVFLDTDSPPEALEEELVAWYDKIKEGGILGGYDHSIHDTVYQNYTCITSDFCKKNKIPLRTYEYQFLIQKPYKTI